MARKKRAAAVLGEGLRRGAGEDPDFDEDETVEVYYRKDTGENKFPGKPFRVQGKDGLYDIRHTNKDGSWESPEDWTYAVHWNPTHGDGHGIWRVLDKSTLFEAPTNKTTAKKVR
jgi:hypothetical protein